MKIQMKTIYASPKRSIKAGEVVEMEDKEAKLLIEGGYAIEHKAVKPAAKADDKADKAADKKRGKHDR